MASFQLEGIPQFGASIAASNTNAPQSSDANAVVSSINQANDLQRSGANNVGLQALSGANSVVQGIKQLDEQQALKAYQQQVGNALANKDTDALQKLYATNPAQAATTQQALGMVNDGLKQDAGNAAMDLKVAFTQGPQAVAAAIQKHQQTLQGMGIDPNQAFQIAQTAPQHFNQVTDLVGMHAIGPDKYFDLQNKNAQLTQNGQIADARYQLDNQKFQYQQKQDGIQNGLNADRVGIERYKAQTGADLNALQLKLQAAHDKATTDNQRQQIQQKQLQIQQAQQEKYGGVANNISAISSNLSQMRDLGSIVKNNPSIVSGTIGLGSQGAVGRYMPTISSASRDFEARRDQVLGSLLTDGSLKAIYGGNPSDGERKALAESVSTLKSATTPQAFNGELQRLQQRAVNSAKRQISALGIPRVQLPANQEAAAVSYLQNNPDQIGAFIQDHGYLPEGYWSTQAGQ